MKMEITGGVVLIDAEDYTLVRKMKWFAEKRPHTYYATAHDGREKIYMHRLIAGTPKGMFTDHINHNGLDNQKSNLRICTRSQNYQNRQVSSGTSSLKGVSWDKSISRWRVRIKISGQPKYIGVFRNEKDAAIAYNKAARRAFGEFACINNIGE